MLLLFMQEVLKKIKPSPEEIKKTAAVVESFLKNLNKNFKKAEAILGGSGAKGTWLKSSHDVDIFVRFNYKEFKERSADLSVLLERQLKKAFPKKNVSKLHGSRDYFQMEYEGIVFEIVPILKIKKAGDAKNITDISPLHAIWVKKNVKQKDDVLLLKQFCKAQGAYGAESHIGGFSGYVLEILIGHYGTFEKVLKASLNWKAKEVIDPARYYQKNTALFHLNKSKQNSPIIVVDPVDKLRNAAAALSEEKYQLFRKKAKEYLQHHSEKLFFKEEIDVKKLQGKKNLLVITINPLAGKKDVVGGKVLKVFHFLQQKLAPFGISKALWEENTMYFVLDKKELPATLIRNGPPLTLPYHVKEFKKKNKQTFIKDGKIYATIAVPYPHIEDFANHLLQEEYIKKKVKKIKLLLK